MKGQYAVIGLGRFGSSLATTLHQAGNEVLAIDRNEERIELKNIKIMLHMRLSLIQQMKKH